MSYSLPGWIEGYALSEACMAEAYAALSAQDMAPLKSCIARLHQIWGEHPERCLSLRCARGGCCLERDDRPAEVAAFVCAADYRHAAPFLAAIMPAVLAGARMILPLFVQANDARPGGILLSALELAGVEQAFLLDEAAALAVLQSLPARGSRLVLLGENSFGASLAAFAHESGLVSLSLARPLEEYKESLSLDAHCAHLWIWPELGPDWFRLPRLRLFAAVP